MDHGALFEEGLKMIRKYGSLTQTMTGQVLILDQLLVTGV